MLMFTFVVATRALQAHSSRSEAFSGPFDQTGLGRGSSWTNAEMRLGLDSHYQSGS